MFKAGFIFYWKINQKYIAERLCENRDKPEMHCKGKCYLVKHLKKTEEKNDSNIPNQILKLKSVDYFLTHCRVYNLSVCFDFYKNKNPSLYFSSLSIGYQNSLFQPPEFI